MTIEQMNQTAHFDLHNDGQHLLTMHTVKPRRFSRRVRKVYAVSVWGGNVWVPVCTTERLSTASRALQAIVFS